VLRCEGRFRLQLLHPGVTEWTEDNPDASGHHRSERTRDLRLGSHLFLSIKRSDPDDADS
jgi:hypothetical protein